MTELICENLINLLFHCEIEKFNTNTEKSKRIFKEECLSEFARYKFRLKQAKRIYDENVRHTRAFIKPLSGLVNTLLKNGFEIKNANLRRTRFELSLIKGEVPYIGILSFGKDAVTIYIYKNIDRIATHVFWVKASKTGVVSLKNNMIRGLIESIQ